MTGSLLILFLCVRDSRENPWNYMAVSPMSVEGKRLESILWDRIYSHLEEVGLIGKVSMVLYMAAYVILT